MRQASNRPAGAHGSGHDPQNVHGGGRPGGRPGHAPRPGARAQRLLKMLARGEDVGALAQRLRRTRPQLEEQVARLLGRLGTSTIAAALQALEASPTAAAAAEELLPSDAPEAEAETVAEAESGGAVDAGEADEERPTGPGAPAA
ncbi:MAG: hypothetical protein KF788_17645 [Piscinibacter sp.]|nr:hypothetical protein [Piscinibacter sp.]